MIVVATAAGAATTNTETSIDADAIATETSLQSLQVSSLVGGRVGRVTFPYGSHPLRYSHPFQAEFLSTNRLATEQYRGCCPPRRSSSRRAPFRATRCSKRGWAVFERPTSDAKTSRRIKQRFEDSSRVSISPQTPREGSAIDRREKAGKRIEIERVRYALIRLVRTMVKFPRIWKLLVSEMLVKSGRHRA